MCIYPQYRPVKYRSLNPAIQTTHIVLKCGHCAECSAERKRDYMIRNYVETCYTLADNGIVLVDTLTYNDNHVPFILVESDVTFTPEEQTHLIKARHYDVELWNIKHPDDKKEWSENLYRVNCFDYNHVQKFFKKFRNYVGYYLCDKQNIPHSKMHQLGIYKEVKDNLRYFLSPELGGKFGRPHYHLTVHCTVKGLSKLKLKGLFDSAWRHLDRKGRYKRLMNHHRFIVYNPNDLGATEGYERLDYNTIKSPAEIAHIKYQTKYVCKNSYMEQLYNKLFGVRSSSHLPQCLHTRVKSSIGLGSQLIDDYKNLFIDIGCTIYVNLDKEKVYIPHSQTDGQNVVGNKAVYNLPQYYIRKMYYRRVCLSDGSWTMCLNANGVLRNIRNYDRKVSNLIDAFKLHVASLPSQYQTEFFKMLGSKSLEDLAQYKLLFYGKTIDYSQWDGTIETYYHNLAYAKVKTYDIPEKAHDAYVSQYMQYHPYSNDEVVVDLQLHNCLDYLNKTRYLYSEWKQHEYVRQHKNELYYKKILKSA